MRYKKEDCPVLIGYKHTEITVKVWCPYCRMWHIHSKNNGHVINQCENEYSPFKKTDYIIKINK